RRVSAGWRRHRGARPAIPRLLPGTGARRRAAPVPRARAGRRRAPRGLSDRAHADELSPPALGLASGVRDGPRGRVRELAMKPARVAALATLLLLVVSPAAAFTVRDMLGREV